MKTIKIIMLITLAGILFNNNTTGQDKTIAAKKIKSRITHEEVTVKGVKNSVIDSEETYDVKGNVIEEIEYKSGKIDKHFLYEYDSENNKTKETELDPAGNIKKFAEFKYENGLRTEKLTFDKDKKQVSRKTYTYTY